MSMNGSIMKTDEDKYKQQILSIPLIQQNYKAKSELQKSQVSHNSTMHQLKNAILPNPKEIQNKIDNFQRNLLHVSNKQIYNISNQDGKKHDNPNKTSDSHGSPISNSHQTSSSQPKRKVFKNFNGKALDMITENQNTPNTINNFQSVYSSEFLDRIVNNNYQNHLSSNQSPLANLKRVESLPSIKQNQMQKQYFVMDNKNSSKRKTNRGGLLSNSQQNPSLNNSQASKNNTIDEVKQKEYYNLDSVNRNNQNQNSSNQNQYKLDEDNNAIDSLNEQKIKILKGVEELKKLRERRFTQCKLKKIDKLKQRISVLQELEKQIPLIENIKGEIDLEKQREIEAKLEQKGDGESSIISSLEGDDCLSRNSDDFIFKKLDEISVTDAGEENMSEKISQFDEVVSTKSKQRTQQEYLQMPSITSNDLTKSTKGSTILESIMEEHQDYFNHIAGKCACGQCNCGKCQVKCQHSQRKPQLFDITWESSYSRSYSHHKTGNNQEQLNDVKIIRKPYQPHQASSQDYTSTFKKDYKYPTEISYQKISKYQRIPESPLYSLSTYKCNYLDWKIGMKEDPLKQSNQKTVVSGVPLLGSSTMKKDYQSLDPVKTNIIKPSDQVPLPRFSINRYQYKKEQSKISPNYDLSLSDTIQTKQYDYIPVPSYEGQYTTSMNNYNKIDQPNCEGTKKLYDMYQRKIEKYQKKLKEQIEKLELAK